ncbi:hypothetical protein [Nocardioides flavescens]|uniref:Uncharacterized protein n=1 Tax=Nocardioides flavescens TaxID=2691959 RepID=A0A6L7EZY8_9ACTN|nr:hypothetical protein [Nocardioides flavescens]MXG89591.1 hypothetical protein [Nocardioides flavescens]
MTPSRAHFVTACQQLLALGVVVVALVPATRVVNLDVVGVSPHAAKAPTLEISGGPAQESADAADGALGLRHGVEAGLLGA